jgi:phage gp36-like protein
MGDYATTSSLSLLMPGYLLQDTTTTDAAATARFSKHVTRAESVVNSAIGRRYSLPFIVGTTTTNVPPILRTLTEDIACYYAMRNSFSQDGKTKNPYLEEYKSAIDILDSIAKGITALTYTDGSEVPAQSTNLFKSTSRNYTPIFALDEPSEWRRDPDEVVDTDSLRQEQ